MLRWICELVSKEKWNKFRRIHLQIFERPMNSVTRDSIRYLSKEISPALVVLLFTILFSEFFSGLSSIKGWELISRIFFRFFRFTLLLCLPLYVLSPIYSFVVERMRGRLLQIERRQEMRIHPLKQWVFRPFEGIGIGLLFETKLLATLQIITGVTAKPFLLSHGNQFQPGRLLVISGITVVISLLLSALWTLDDVGIRYVSRKNQEIKMIGKYVGTIMPILFGFYGILSLIADFPTVQVFIYLLKTVMILYPPFVVFTICHAHFIKNRGEYLSQISALKKGGVWHGGE